MRGSWVLGLVLVATAARAERTGPECVEANERAISHREKLELLASRHDLEACASPRCPAVIVAECSARLREVAEEIPTIVFAVKDERGADLRDVAVTMDGKPFAAPLGAAALEVDPGTHTFEFRAHGKSPLSKTLVVREGEKDRHELVTLASPSAPPPRRTGGTARTVGFVVGAAGLAGVIAGSVFGALAFSENATADANCPFENGTGCNSTGVQAGKDADLSATISTIAFAAGLTCLAAGVVLVLVGGPKQTTSARVELAPAGAGMLLRGTF